MKIQPISTDRLLTERLILMPFTLQICNNLMHENFSDLAELGFIKGKSWPDGDVMETLPRIINNLSRVEAPTGFESWMIIRRDTLEVIGDLGFKGLNHEAENADLGYGIIKEERRKGYAAEAATALIRWAFSTEMVREITAQCAIENTGSIRLLLHLNFTEIKRDDEMICWSLPGR